MSQSEFDLTDNVRSSWCAFDARTEIDAQPSMGAAPRTGASAKPAVQSGLVYWRYRPRPVGGRCRGIRHEAVAHFAPVHRSCAQKTCAHRMGAGSKRHSPSIRHCLGQRVFFSPGLVAPRLSHVFLPPRHPPKAVSQR